MATLQKNKWPTECNNLSTDSSSLFQAAASQDRGYQTVQDMAEEFKAAEGIKAMPEDSRPRKKLFSLGGANLRTEELLAILVGLGTPVESAVELGKRIFDDHGGRERALKGCTFCSLCKFKGMGIAKASTILAAIELARRIYMPAPEFKTVYLVKKPGIRVMNLRIFLIGIEF